MIVSLIAAIPKALWNVSETILTMMLNYVVLLFLNYLMYGPWKEAGQMVPQTPLISERYYLPDIGNTGINSVLLIAIALAVVIFFFHKKSSRGYQMEVIRRSPSAANYAGMSVKKNIIFVLAVSGCDRRDWPDLPRWEVLSTGYRLICQTAPVIRESLLPIWRT